jgi:hypothetical protein
MSEGSDCVTGKTQYANKEEAVKVAQALRRQGRMVSAFRCSWCGCHHTGNQRRNNSKARHRR